MEYPGTKFTKKYRTAFFITFISLFFIISPLIILYTAGYSYDFKQGIVKETGGISIDIEPKNSSIFINNEYINESMPVRLKNVAPGNYDIKINAGDNYYEWQKELKVEKRQTVYIKDIELIKKNSPKIIKETEVEDMKISNDKNYLVYITQNKNTKEIWVYNIKTLTHNLIIRINSNNNLKISWAKNNNYFFISEEKKPYENIFIINAQYPEKQTNLTKNIKNKEEIKKIEWKEDKTPELFFQQGEIIYSYKPETGYLNKIIDNNFIDWMFDGGQLWTLEHQTTTGKYIIFKDKLGFTSQYKELKNGLLYQNFQFLEINNDTIAIKNKNSTKTLLIKQNDIFELPIENIKISEFDNWWLMWSPWEIWSYSPEEQEPLLLNRSGEQLSNIIPLDKYNTLALIWENRATVLFPYYLVGHDLINQKIKHVNADIEDKTLFFYTEIDGKTGIWKINY